MLLSFKDKDYLPQHLNILQVHINAKPPYSFSCLIFMAIEDSSNKALPVKDIYAWILDHFPYFRNAPTGWKNSVRHNLSLNKCFRKVEKAPVSHTRFPSHFRTLYCMRSLKIPFCNLLCLEMYRLVGTFSMLVVQSSIFLYFNTII